MSEGAELDSEQEEFYPVKFDRTPYGACWVAAGVFAVVTVLGVALLWRSAIFVKRHTRDWKLPGSSGDSTLMSDVESRLNPKAKASVTPINPADVQNQIQNDIRTQAEKAASQAVQDAANQAAAATQKQLQDTGQKVLSPQP